MKLVSTLLFLISQSEIKEVIAPVIEIINAIIPNLLLIVGSLAGIWCILLGVKYAKADDPQEHEKAKKGLVNAIVGFCMIFVLLACLKLAISLFTTYYNTNGKPAGAIVVQLLSNYLHF